MYIPVFSETRMKMYICVVHSQMRHEQTAGIANSLKKKKFRSTFVHLPSSAAHLPSSP
jgi:hypothetical protein